MILCAFSEKIRINQYETTNYPSFGLSKVDIYSFQKYGYLVFEKKKKNKLENDIKNGPCIDVFIEDSGHQASFIGFNFNRDTET